MQEDKIGSANSQYLLALHYFDIEKTAEALKLFHLAALQEHPNAQSRLGQIYEGGMRVKRDYAEAARWFQRAANNGNALGQHHLGICYENGQGVKQDLKMAFELYAKAADQNFPDSLHNVGRFYEKGILGVKNDTEALKWYQKAADQGHIISKSKILQWSKSRDASRAETAKRGDPNAQHDLGVRFFHGRSFEKAFNLFVASAGQGYSKSQNFLGYLYENGFGVKRNVIMAFYWYQKSAASGDSVGQNNLGSLYESGEGVGVNLKLAFGYYIASALQGNPEAMYNVARCYFSGITVPQNKLMAATWLKKLIKFNGDEEAAEFLKIVEAEMSPSLKSASVVQVEQPNK